MNKQALANQARTLAAQVQKLNDAVLELPYEAPAQRDDFSPLSKARTNLYDAITGLLAAAHYLDGGK